MKRGIYKVNDQDQYHNYKTSRTKQIKNIKEVDHKPNLEEKVKPSTSSNHYIVLIATVWLGTVHSSF